MEAPFDDEEDDTTSNTGSDAIGHAMDAFQAKNQGGHPSDEDKDDKAKKQAEAAAKNGKGERRN